MFGVCVQALQLLLATMTTAIESGLDPLSLLNEDVIPLSAVPDEIPGKQIHPTTVWRWSNRGVRGIRLEVVKVGYEIRTSRQAVRRFLERINLPATSEPGVVPS